MRLLASNSRLLVLIAAAAHANPIAQPTSSLGKGINCNQVNVVLNVIKALGPPATSFCSSYLHIPAPTTRITTIAPAIVTVPTSTVTVETIQPQCPALAKRYADLVEDTAAIEKRINLPALSVFAAAKLSTACGCLGLTTPAPATRTVTPPATTVNVIVTTTSCITCSPDGRPCTFDRPDLCCGRACLRVLPPVPGGPEATCISF
ncbi:hypothetical protein BKA63DRAFT_312064 [Paraphoma chrysanthemicola]|nr:hypothetical protein BKA63DRAFT_312064 [Paraphoma chrysanthemicola]